MAYRCRTRELDNNSLVNQFDVKISFAFTLGVPQLLLNLLASNVSL